MERRLLLAFILFFTSLVLYQHLKQAITIEEPAGAAGSAVSSVLPGGDVSLAASSDEASETTAPPGSATGTATDPSTASGASATGAATTPDEPLPPAVRPTADEPAVQVNGPRTDIYSASRFTTRGASMSHLSLAGYHAPDGETDLTLVGHTPFPSFLVRDLEGRQQLDTRCWTLEESGADRVVFSIVTDDGLLVRKRFIFVPERYHLLVDIAVENRSGQPRSFGYDLLGTDSLPLETKDRGGGLHLVVGRRRPEDVVLDEINPSALIDDHKSRFTIPAGEITYGGVDNKYFATVIWPESREGLGDFLAFPLLPETDAVAEAVPGRELEDDAEGLGIMVSLRVSKQLLEPGASFTRRFTAYVGPKDKRILEVYDEEAAEPGNRLYLAKLRRFPTLLGLPVDSLSALFLFILVSLRALLPGYGLAIILLTLLVKVILHPMSIKSQRSMAKMQELKPKMEEIRGRYAGKKDPKDAQRMNEEILKLYKEHNVNPFMGCLPIFIQLPVFIGLYNALLYGIELRQAPFLYINDLSQPDHLMRLSFLLPWPLETNWLNLLPILMMVAMIAQQRMMPKPEDPQMQQQMKIMSFMFIVLGFIFYTVPSGLVLYFLTSSIFGMIESGYIRRQIELDKAARASS